MAVDAALMQRARDTGEAVFRVYSWARPTVSFGRNQAAQEYYSAALLMAAGVDVVRRPTGGRAILHQREITYSVTAPALPATPLKAAYGVINDMLLEGLNMLGAGAQIAQASGRAGRPTAAPCFAGPSEGEMMAQGRKLVGSAQWREDGALLQHGSILVEDDQGLLINFMTTPLDITTPVSAAMPGAMPAATLRSILGRTPSASEVAASLFEVVRRRADPHAAALPVEPVVSASRAFEGTFIDEAWTWRR